MPHIRTIMICLAICTPSFAGDADDSESWDADISGQSKPGFTPFKPGPNQGGVDVYGYPPGVRAQQQALKQEFDEALNEWRAENKDKLTAMEQDEYIGQCTPDRIDMGGSINPDDLEKTKSCLSKRLAVTLEFREKKVKQWQAALSKYNPGDVVAQVLNYSSFGYDNPKDSKADFWYRVDDCKYDLATGGLTQPIDLNKADPRGWTFENMQQYDRQGRLLEYSVVKYEGNIVFMPNMFEIAFGGGKRDLNRLQRGWALIYSEHCKGVTKPF